MLFWLLIFGGLASFAGLLGLVAAGFFGELPTFEELENPTTNLATEIYSADQKLLGKYFRENRTNARYEELSPHLINALVSTEDERYYGHSGIDFKGLARAVFFLGKRGGASTITQQLAKNLFRTKEQLRGGRIMQKFGEWIISVQLEKQYTKEEIIMMYYNTFDFINNAVGVKSAAAVYFNKSPDSLKIEEAAMLVGMAKNPSLFNPLRRPDTTKHRRNVVLYQTMRNEYITKTEFDSLKQLDIVLDYKIVDHKEGIAPYFREILRAELTKIFREKDGNGNYKISNTNGKPYNIYSDGLKVYTTINSRMQQYGERAVQRHLGGYLQSAFFRDLRNKRNAPFDWRVSKKEVEQILKSAMHRTKRYRVLAGKECVKCGRRGKYVQPIKENEINYYKCTAEDCQFQVRTTPKDSIEIIFNTPVKMKVFTWQGEKDTTLSPLDSIKYYKSFLQAGFMAMDPHTGFVKAWVGGVNSKHFAYDHVRQSRRQVGSTFKPFVYAIAIKEIGYSPCHELPNHRPVFEKDRYGLEEDWSPKNSDGSYGCMVSLKYALANSLNTITAKLMKEIGPQAVVDFARKMGITSPLMPVPALALGVADLTVYELVGANATFANKGVWTKPIFITRVEDKNGSVIKEFKPEKREVLSEETAYVMLELMKGVVNGAYNRCMGDKMKVRKEKTKRGFVCYTCGTGVRIRGRKTESRPYVGISYPIAAKTGTTQNNSDGWFIGITPDLVAGCWVGAEDRSVRFTNTEQGQGANMALPIWGYFMNEVYEDESLNISTGDFEKPDYPLSIELNCEKYWQTHTGTDYDPSFDE
ncbi:MAG: penicillin-binding protein [Flavobacteriales bacterium]|nr:MAG: penicillin-binding protein [Flavobacteriales bacterium]